MLTSSGTGSRSSPQSITQLRRASISGIRTDICSTALGDTVTLTYWQEWFDTFINQSNYKELKRPDQDFAKYLAAHPDTQKEWNAFVADFSGAHPDSSLPVTHEAEAISQDLRILKKVPFSQS
jgi:hypothetical protein